MHGYAGALYFVIFDSSLNIFTAHTPIATEYTPGNIVYHDSIALAGGGFAVVYQTSAGTAID